MATPRDDLRKARRIVVKVGTQALLTEDQQLDRGVVARLLGEIADLRDTGCFVCLVTSGAIGLGFRVLGHSSRPRELPDLQASAAVGQGLLIQAYNGVLKPRGYAAAQLLLTHEDFQDRRRYLNMRHTFRALEGRPVVPVINENDTVAIEEITFGDNDILAGLVANLVGAEALILLSDVDALYSANPKKVPDATRLNVVEEITQDIEAAVQDTEGGMGSGGMGSKIRAAQMATASGAAVVVAHGKKVSLKTLLDGAPIGTLFRPSPQGLDHRARWLAFVTREAGKLQVDAGAAAALTQKGKSLLSAGITHCEGTFQVGDPVLIADPQGRPLAKGLVNYSSADVDKIRGRRSSEIEGILGAKPYDEVIHRDNLVLL